MRRVESLMSVETSDEELASLMRAGQVAIYPALHLGKYAICVDFTNVPPLQQTPCFGAKGAVLRIAQGSSPEVNVNPHGRNVWKFLGEGEITQLTRFCAEQNIELKPRVEQICR